MKSNTSDESKVYIYTDGGEPAVPKDVVHVRFHHSVVEVRDYTFSSCTQLKKVELNEGLQSSGDYAFAYCKSLQSITLPSTITKIGYGTFEGCKSLKEIVLNDGLEKIGRYSFNMCQSLQSIKLPSTVTEIDDVAFCKCRQLKKVVLNEGLQKIGLQAFELCISLESISLPSTVTEVSPAAFCHCNKLRKVVLNDGLQKLGHSAFEYCGSLTNIKLPSTLTKGICDETFRDCKSLESIIIPSTITDLGLEAFYGCSRLRKVVLNEGLKSIGGKAFYACSSLESITLPSTLTHTGVNTFDSCGNLKEILINGDGRELIFGDRCGAEKNYRFDECSSLERIIFPSISSRLDGIIRAGQTGIKLGVDETMRKNEIDIVRRDSEIFAPIMRLVGDIIHFSWYPVKNSLSRIDTLVSFYEMKEAGTLFELALWKAKIDQAWESDDVIVKDRYAYRIEVPGPVKDTILLFLLGSHTKLMYTKSHYRGMLGIK